MPLQSEKLTNESSYWIFLPCNHPHIMSIYAGRARICLDSRFEVDSPSEIDVTSVVFSPKQRLHCSCFRKGSCVQVRGGGFARGAPILLSPPTQVFHRSHEKRSVRWQPGNLPVICRGDRHHVGGLGRSASPHAAERPPMGLTTNNTLEHTHGAWYFTDDR